MSFINGLLAFTASKSYQPSLNITCKFCSGQIALHWTRKVISIPSCQMRRLPRYSSSLQSDFRVWCRTHTWLLLLQNMLLTFWSSMSRKEIDQSLPAIGFVSSCCVYGSLPRDCFRGMSMKHICNRSVIYLAYTSNMS
jgi:hypothetical protein